jgi:hypothetical protein
VGAPLIALALVRHRRLGWCLALATGFVLFFPALPADARYLVTVLPLLSLALGLAVGDVLLRWRWGRTRGASVALAVALVLPGWLYAGYRIARQGALPTTSAAREAYLLRVLPLYPAVARVNRLLRPGDRVYGLHAEEMRDHVRGEYLGDWYGPHRYALLEERLAAPGAFHAVLQEWGVDFLLVARDRVPPLPVVRGEGRALELLYEDDAALLYAVRTRSGGG